MGMKTYGNMDKEIVDLLRLTDDPMCHYAAKRIEELEGENKRKDLIKINNPPTRESMNIYAKPGHEVIVTRETSKNGYTEDKEKIKRLLSLSKVYTVEGTEVGGSRTRVFLKEFPGVPFNSVNFEDVEKSIPPLRD